MFALVYPGYKIKIQVSGTPKAGTAPYVRAGAIARQSASADERLAKPEALAEGRATVGASVGCRAQAKLAAWRAR